MRIRGVLLNRVSELLMLAALAVGAVPQLLHAQTTYTLLHTFGGTDGSMPDGTLLRDGFGNLYGTTIMGGAFNAGTVFKVDTSGNESVLYTFTGGADGGYPYAGLIRDSSGNFYGTTEGGGTAAAGTVFKLDAAGHETVLHSFAGGLDGAVPTGGVIRDEAGNLYGTTIDGGRSNCQGLGCGTVFKLDTFGKKTILYNFSGWPHDGAGPVAGVIRDSAGNLYGTTVAGGRGNQGTAYRIAPDGTETILHVFFYDGQKGQRVDGTGPYGGLISDAAGNLYGTTDGGGTFNAGTVFKIDVTGNEHLLYSFAGYPTDTAFPASTLVRDASGNLYGAGGAGGTDGHGTIFKLDSAGSETLLYVFLGGPEGAVPVGGLVRDRSSGNLYGTTQDGGGNSGLSGNGVVFEFSTP